VITAPFKNVKLSKGHFTSILYHNTPFVTLFQLIKDHKDEFQVAGKALVLIPISNFIRLFGRDESEIISETDFGSLKAWLKKYYPHETIKMWKLATDSSEKEFYLQTRSRESLVFIYLVMVQF
jgi:hypothetical protein